jgi:hypothetical protein
MLPWFLIGEQVTMLIRISLFFEYYPSNPEKAKFEVFITPFAGSFNLI